MKNTCVLCYTEITKDQNSIEDKKPTTGIFNNTKVKMHYRCYDFFKKINIICCVLLAAALAIIVISWIAYSFSSINDTESYNNKNFFTTFLLFIVAIIVSIAAISIWFFLSIRNFRKRVKDGTEKL